MKLNALYRGIIAASGVGNAVSAADPYWSNVTLLLRAVSGAPVDVSPVGATFASAAGLNVPTSGGIFGDGNIILTSGYFSFTNGSQYQFGTGDFTVEGFFYFPPGAAGCRLTDRYQPGAAAGTWAMNFGTGAIGFTEVVDGEPGCSAAFDMTSGLVHVAACRKSGVLTLFANGNPVASNSSFGYDLTNTSYPFKFTDGNGNGAYATLDEIRITKGVARYNAAFTPPTTRFPSHG